MQGKAREMTELALVKQWLEEEGEIRSVRTVLVAGVQASSTGGAGVGVEGHDCQVNEDRRLGLVGWVVRGLSEVEVGVGSDTSQSRPSRLCS